MGQHKYIEIPFRFIATQAEGNRGMWILQSGIYHETWCHQELYLDTLSVNAYLLPQTSTSFNYNYFIKCPKFFLDIRVLHRFYFQWGKSNVFLGFCIFYSYRRLFLKNQLNCSTYHNLGIMFNYVFTKNKIANLKCDVNLILKSQSWEKGLSLHDKERIYHHMIL